MIELLTFTYPTLIIVHRFIIEDEHIQVVEVWCFRCYCWWVRVDFHRLDFTPETIAGCTDISYKLPHNEKVEVEGRRPTLELLSRGLLE